MTKVKFNPILSRIEGTSYEAYLPQIGEKPPDFCFSKNQYANILMRKPKSTKRATEAQKFLRDRFKQLECMWKALTPLQRNLYIKHAKEQEKKDKRGLRTYDRFRSEGLEYKLNTFLEENCNPKYLIRIEKIDDEYIYLRLFLLSRVIEEWNIISYRGVRG